MAWKSHNLGSGKEKTLARKKPLKATKHAKKSVVK